MNGSRLRLKAKVVIHSVPQSLFAAQIPFGRLHTDMSEQELDLLEFSPCEVTQTRARVVPKILLSTERSRLAWLPYRA
jgi:hypothetical protein